MALTPLQQSVDVLQNAHRILIAPSAELTGDSLAGAYALGMACEAAGKDACVLMPEDASQRFSFLPRPSRVSKDPLFEREYVLSIDTRAVPVKELRYERADDALKLYLTAPAHFSREHVSFEPGPHTHDLVITVAAADLESLGAAFERHPHLFAGAPILNIDCRAANERYGSINIVEIAAATVSELISDILEAWNAEALTADVATCLLAGITDGTKSFQEASVTPRTLQAAAKLLERGARQDEVVRHLYKSRGLERLRLWGRILGRLVVTEPPRLAYAVVPAEDFTETAATPRDLPESLEDLHLNFPHFATIALFFWHQNGDSEPVVRGLVSSREEMVLERAVAQFAAKRRGDIVSFRLGVSKLEDAPPLFLREYAR